MHILALTVDLKPVWQASP